MIGTGTRKDMDSNASNLKSNRIEYLDFARGLCMIAIIMGHLSVPQLNRVVYTFHLPVFYLITGYFFNAKKGIFETVKQKFFTLLCPYYFTCVLIILVTIIFDLTIYRKSLYITFLSKLQFKLEANLSFIKYFIFGSNID